MIFTEFSTPTIVWCIFALFCGGLIKGALGIGTPLLTVPMLALVMPAQSAITLMAIPIVAANVWQSAQAKDLRDAVSDFYPTALALIAATFASTSMLAIIPEKTLLILVGFMVIALTIQQASSYEFSIPRSQLKTTGILFGMMSGLIGGISSMFGPMLILYLVSLKDFGKNEFVGAISLLYLCAVIPWAISLNVNGLLVGSMLWSSCLATAPVAAGVLFGEFVREFISDKQFKNAVLVVLLISGSSMIWQAFLH